MARILVADDEAGLREFITDSLELDDHTVVPAKDGQEAAKLLEQSGFDLVLTDLKMPRLDGMSLLRKVRAEQPEVEVIVMTAHGSVENAVEAMKLGAFEYLQKPISGPDELRLLVSRAVERRKLHDRVDGTERDAEPAQPRLTYGDPAMRPVVEAIEKVARTAATVLLLGESGTGKEVAARAIHAQSPRTTRPFSAINCAALSEQLLESELFGHEKGAFTGATERKRGRLELSDGGTFFLDEVGELKPELQAKLLRVLQERRFERVGGSQTLQVDVRWIAATNRDLRSMIDAGTFREDLYHRLAVFPIKLPPLRERTTDLLPLARALLDRVARDLKRSMPKLAPSAEKRLLAATWRGNVRELANTLERAAILADGDLIDAAHIWLEDAGAKPPTRSDEVRPLVELEREAILHALEVVGGNRRRAAELLGIGERTLYDKLKKYGVD
ncbi:MAG: sigma-54-dependent Fis family transcriptional regulator [Deltaproteobacteria bacterium]|nr:sigma-54-dependent Fis family transcriptional regulator [Deltaproteobacteria bacterium]MCW5808764.1 sigma-54-dependent Fis family transcriptional regulator [Deltaproteobacteria bacterium]